MADSRTAQVFTETVASIAADTRTAQTFVETVGAIHADTRTAQVFIEVVVSLSRAATAGWHVGEIVMG